MCRRVWMHINNTSQVESFFPDMFVACDFVFELSKVTSSKERHKIFMAVNNNSGCCAGINFEGWAPIAGNGSGKVLVVSVRYNAVVTCSYKGDTHVSTLWTEIIDNG